jgi:aquaporin Z
MWEMSQMKKQGIAEFIGTFTLVFVGCGTAVIEGKAVGFLGIAFAFGLALTAMAYSIGPVSGCHINPAVSLGMFAAGRMTGKELVWYVVSQCLGAILGALAVLFIAQGKLSGFAPAVEGLGQNGWGQGYLGEYSLVSALLFEFIASWLFVFVILNSTRPGPAQSFAGLIIGLTLTVIHILGINITGVSVNPARSLGPALFVGSNALSQLWLFLIVPSVAGFLAGRCARCCDSERLIA